MLHGVVSPDHPTRGCIQRLVGAGLGAHAGLDVECGVEEHVELNHLFLGLEFRAPGPGLDKLRAHGDVGLRELRAQNSGS